jgi:Phytanoyl-CoA dioxygenase (PhyH)
MKAIRSMARHLRSRIHKDELYWRYAANFKPSLTYHLFRPSLKDVQRDVLDSLRCNGIAITTVEDLGVQDAFNELDKAVWTLEATLSNTINQAREQVDAPGFKTYLLELLGPRPVLDPKDIFVRFGLQPVILSLVNSYFGMYVRLRSFNVWHNFPSGSPPRNSRLWHRDPEDRYIVKLFVYLTDATDGIGPLTYALGTHGLGRIKSRPQASRAEGTGALRNTDEQASVVVPKAKWLTTMGPKGTVVLADTRGYHKAGLARDRERVLYTCMFTSQVSPYPEHFERKTPIPVYSDRALAFALDGEPTA